ncbi:unnamed protein product [Hermetia illucens]|uniref:Complex 1 LYR protein domain-containing protein n=1 Tax=Hermetia illucens TaxID=343691 RepID=A0A7R8YML2_HERIL|nr:LYR motif-containing protein 4 [Hermetia illucens]CAD7077562.1 unnamed protein product [Hermetia illucens]
MATGEIRMKVLSLYKSLLRESQKFSSYNFRMYALRKIRDEFREKKLLTDPARIKEEINFAEKNLGIIKRQVIVGNLYSTEKLIIEKNN